MAPRGVLPTKVTFPISGRGNSKLAFGTSKPTSDRASKRSAIGDIATPPPTKVGAAAQHASLAHMHSHPSHHCSRAHVRCAAGAMLMLTLTAPLRAREAAQRVDSACGNPQNTTTITTHTYLFSHHAKSSCSIALSVAVAAELGVGFGSIADRRLQTPVLL